MRTLTRRPRRAMIAGILLFAATQAARAQTAGDAKGKYVLARLADAPLPATVNGGKAPSSVVDGWIEVYANGSWILKFTVSDDRGRKHVRADFGNAARVGDSLTFTSGIYGTHGAALTPTTLELSYDVGGDTTSERMIFARPGIAPQTVAAATTPGATPASPTPTAPPPPLQPASPPPGSPAQQPPAASARPNEPAPNDNGPALFDPAGLYHLQLLNRRRMPSGAGGRLFTGGTLQIANGKWEIGLSVWGELGEAHMASDRGTLSASGSRIVFRSDQYGDFQAVASGKGTITMDFSLAGDSTLARYVWVKDGVDDDPIATMTVPSGSQQTAGDPGAWSAVAAGAFQSCGLTAQGKVYCWGLRSHPVGSAGGEWPTPVASDVAFTALTTGNPTACSPSREDESCASSRFYHVCALAADGAAYCWGSNELGQLGDGTTTEHATPQRVTGGLTFASISAGDAFTCGVTRTQALYCWGKNAAGQLGIGAADNVPHPAPMPVAQGVRSVAAGGEFACALRDDGAALCWGQGGSDRLGTSNALGFGPNPSPLPVETDVRFASLSIGRAHACGLTSDGVAFCWGSNGYHEAGPGVGAGGTAHTPTRVPGPPFSALTAGTANHTCAVARSGAAYCWGNDNRGQLGSGDGDPEVCGLEQWGCASVPVPVAGGHVFASVSAGVDFSCGVTTGGEAYCWGDNSRGQLGTGDRKAHRTPARIGR